jgi:hypothetical protein
MHSQKRQRAFHGPQGDAGILPAEESEKRPADETSAAPSWRHRSSASSIRRLGYKDENDHEVRLCRRAEIRRRVRKVTSRLSNR